MDTLPRCHSTVRGLMWIPSAHPAARRGAISLDELASLDVIHGPRRASPATYDRWLAVLRSVDPRFAFTDPPFRHSLPIVLAFAATASRPAAVLTGPAVIAGPPPGVIRLPRIAAIERATGPEAAKAARRSRRLAGNPRALADRGGGRSAASARGDRPRRPDTAMNSGSPIRPDQPGKARSFGRTSGLLGR